MGIKEEGLLPQNCSRFWDIQQKVMSQTVLHLVLSAAWSSQVTLAVVIILKGKNHLPGDLEIWQGKLLDFFTVIVSYDLLNVWLTGMLFLFFTKQHRM